MGSAIAEGIKAKYRVFAFDKDTSKTQGLKGLMVSGSMTGAVEQSDAVILAVKPQDFDEVLLEIKYYVSEKLVISIAAGITTGYIEKVLGEVRIIRVMPNICAKIGEAESSLAKGRCATAEDLDFSLALFNTIGKAWVMQEEMINAATAIAGSGPAYIYYDMEKNNLKADGLPEPLKQSYIERLTEAAKRVGFDGQTASELASMTTGSSIRLSALKGLAPAELRKQVTSKGGTTEAAIKVLESGGSWADAAEAALARAKELSKS